MVSYFSFLLSLLLIVYLQTNCCRFAMYTYILMLCICYCCFFLKKEVVLQNCKVKSFIKLFFWNHRMLFFCEVFISITWLKHFMHVLFLNPIKKRFLNISLNAILHVYHITHFYIELRILAEIGRLIWFAIFPQCPKGINLKNVATFYQCVGRRD